MIDIILILHSKGFRNVENVLYEKNNFVQFQTSSEKKFNFLTIEGIKYCYKPEHLIMEDDYNMYYYETIEEEEKIEK